MAKMHTEQQKISPPKPRRRSFFSWLWGAFAVIACIEVGWIVNSIFKTRAEKKIVKTAEIIDAGMITDFKPGTVKAVPEGQFYIACLEDGSFMALSRTCTHLGCSVPWNQKESRFICPCHGSTFDVAGSVLTPPATRPLDYYPLRIENGLIRVDISKPLKRDVFSGSQATRI